MTIDAIPDLRPLIGRTAELARLRSRVDGGARLVTLTGPGGSGKTRLAIEALRGYQRAGVEAYFIDLVGVSNPALVSATIASGLGVRETAESDPEASVVAAISGRDVLLVLDNLEELLGAASSIGRLLAACPRLRVIATSRVPLGIPGEVEFPVPPLALPATDAADDVQASAAGALFLERARALGRLDDVDPQTASVIAQLCRRLDGLPLALELAAARTRVLSPAAILSRLDKRTPDTISRGQSNGRHASLETVLAWSIDLLGETQRDLLSAVALCPGGFGLDTAAALAPGVDILDSLDLLASHGLARSDGEIGGEPRYRLLETIRVAALERLDKERARMLWSDLANHMRSLAADLSWKMSHGDPEALRRLDAEQDNVRAVLDWAERADPVRALAIAHPMSEYWRFTGKLREAVSRLEGLLALGVPYCREVAEAMRDLYYVGFELHGDNAVAPIALELARMAMAAGDSEAELEALLLQSSVSPEAALRIRELARSTTDPDRRVRAYNVLALTGGQHDNWAATLENLRLALDVARSEGFKRYEAVGLANLALTHLYRNEPAAAMECAPRAVDIFRTSGGGSGLAWGLGLLAIAAALTGRAAEARVAAADALDLAGTIGGESVISEALWAAIPAILEARRPDLAATAWGAAQAAMASAGMLEADRRLAERLLQPVRQAMDPIKFEVAQDAGRKAPIRDVVADVLAALAAPTTGPAGERPHLAHGELTRREVEVLRLLGSAQTDAEIAKALYISPKTASVHVSNIKAKLGVESRLDAALKARELGLVDDPAASD